MDYAFNDELQKLSGKGSVFQKAINSLKGLGTKAKNLGKSIDKKVQTLGKSVTKGARKASGGRIKGDLRKKRTKRVAGYGTVGAGLLGALGLKELVD